MIRGAFRLPWTLLAYRFVRDFLIVIIVVFILGSFAVSWTMVHPRHETGDRYPSLFTLESENFTVTTDDGVDIHGWFIPSKAGGKRPTVIVMHPYGTGKYDVIDWTYMMADTVNLAFFDFRGHGESGGSSALGMKETRDLDAVEAYVAARPEQDGARLAFMGYGMGAAVALRAAGDAPTLIVADTPVTKPGDIIDQQYPDPKWLVKPFVWLGSLMARAPFGFAAKDPLNGALEGKSAQTHVTYMHVEGDPIVPIAETDALMNITPDPVEIWRIPGSMHGVIYGAQRNAYKDWIKQQLETAFGTAP